MKNLFIFLLIINSCKFNMQPSGYDLFKKELSTDVINKIEKNLPFQLSDNTIITYKYFSYFELFGNSGINVQYAITNKNLLKEKLENYKSIQNNLIIYDSLKYIYKFKDQNLDIKIPDISEDFDNLSTINMKNSNEVTIYVIESGNLKNTYKNETTKNNFYTNGLYYFKEKSLIVYWFLIYSEKN